MNTRAWLVQHDRRRSFLQTTKVIRGGFLFRRSRATRRRRLDHVDVRQRLQKFAMSLAVA
jgi:hypothetical protein